MGFPNDQSNPAGAIPVYVTAQTAATSFVASQVTVADTATLISAARDNRASITIANLGATDVFIGPDDDVTTSNGALLASPGGPAITLATTSAIYGIVGALTQDVSVIETF